MNVFQDKVADRKTGVIVFLTYNDPVRKTYLKTSLYFLFRNYNARYRYPVIIFHEGDYDAESQQEIFKSVRHECRSLIRFQQLDSDDFKIPEWIDSKKVMSNIERKPVPYWRNLKYRLMCRWWIVHLMKYVKDYEYVMRLDDDSIIEEPLDNDLFGVMKEKDAVYASNILHVDCGICCYGMYDLFTSMFPTEGCKNMFKASSIEIGPRVNELLEIVKDTEPQKFEKILNAGEVSLPMPVMFYNNFFIMSTKFWSSQAVQDAVSKVDQSGGIFYYRWGDAPIQSLIVGNLTEKTKVMKFTFRYSKRMHREVFYGDDGKLYEFMPQSYRQSSCITEGS